MYQKITLVGRLGQDPQMRYTSSGTAVTSLNVATDRSWTDRNTGQRETRTVWFRVNVWGGQAEPCNQYLSKGRMVLVEGEMQEPRVFQGRDGEYRSSLEVRASHVVFLGGTRADGGGTSSSGADYAGPSDDVISDIDEEEIPF